MGTNSRNQTIFKIVFPETDICTLKKGSIPYAQRYLPDISLLAIDEKDFHSFLVGLGAEKNRWLLRFWDLREAGGVGRAISVGREHPDLYDHMVTMLSGQGRLHAWAGVEVTPPGKAGVGVMPPGKARVDLYRYPTASISVKTGLVNSSKYRAVEKKWEDFLLTL